MGKPRWSTAALTLPLLGWFVTGVLQSGVMIVPLMAIAVVGLIAAGLAMVNEERPLWLPLLAIGINGMFLIVLLPVLPLGIITLADAL